jgi:hypothetical protein
MGSPPGTGSDGTVPTTGARVARATACRLSTRDVTVASHPTSAANPASRPRPAPSSRSTHNSGAKGEAGGTASEIWVAVTCPSGFPPGGARLRAANSTCFATALAISAACRGSSSTTSICATTLSSWLDTEILSPSRRGVMPRSSERITGSRTSGVSITCTYEGIIACM